MPLADRSRSPELAAVAAMVPLIVSHRDFGFNKLAASESYSFVILFRNLLRRIFLSSLFYEIVVVINPVFPSPKSRAFFSNSEKV